MLTRLVLQLVKSLPPLCDLRNVLSHDANGVVNLRLNLRSLGVAC